MRILELRSENFKRLKAVAIRPDGSLVTISGKNGAGKTSILDSIHVALAGKAVAPAVPIRKGEEQARIRLDLGELVVTRTFSRKGEDEYTTSLVVESADGARFPSPQKMLDDLLGELSFDPLAFTRMPPKDQLANLRKFVPDVDFAAIENANRTDYETRRDVNREIKPLRAQLAALKIPGNPRQERVDESALVQQLEQAGEHNAEIERRKARRARVARGAESSDRLADQFARQAAELKRQLEKAEQAEIDARRKATELRSKLAAAETLPDPVDTAEIKAAIDKARETNREVETRERATKEHERLKTEAEAAEERSAELTKAMEGRAAQVSAAVAAAKLPVDGISFADDAVLYNGLPLEQASDAEQLRISVAIAAAMNPKLRVIRIRDGSLLDENGLRLVAELAEQQDMQVWLEKVDSSGRVGFVIEEGALKVAEAEAETAA